MKYAIVTDFDGTLTKEDVADLLVSHFKVAGVKCAPNNTCDDEAKHWMRCYMGAIKAGQKEFEAYVTKAAEAREGLVEMIGAAFAKDVPFEIVSGGLDIYINPVLKKYNISGIPVYAANGVFTTEGIKVDYPLLENFTLADFKASRVKHFKKLGYKTIFCGDGFTDFEAAKEADILFARAHLLDLCVRKNIPANELVTFKEIIGIIS